MVLDNVSQIETTREIFDFWFLFPIGGLALLSVKKWSYPIFVGVQVYNIYAHLTYEQYTWPYVNDSPFVTSLALLIVNALVIAYFALPAVRRPFFDKSVRWWETRQRYKMRIPLSFHNIDENRPSRCDILNISQSGIFINTRKDLAIGSEIKMNFVYKDFEISLFGVVKSQHYFNDEPGSGVEFKFRNIWESLYVRKLIKKIASDIELEKSTIPEQFNNVA